MLNINQFRELIVKPALFLINAYSKDAEELLVFTCAVESLGGTYLNQINGPAHRIYHMEPDTHNDIWDNFIYDNRPLLTMLSTNLALSQKPFPNRMVYDLLYATIMARIHYMRVSEPLPLYESEESLWFYYKRYYNTMKGKADKTTSLIKYNNFIHSHLDNC